MAHYRLFQVLVWSLAMTTHSLLLRGHVPSKKNKLRPSGAGRKLHNDPVVASEILALEWLARIAWGAAPPIEYTSAIRAMFYVRDGCADLDSKWTTVQDVLVKAHVLRNDSIARVARVSYEARIDADERVEIEIDERPKSKKVTA